jgi:hypothetical protein
VEAKFQLFSIDPELLLNQPLLLSKLLLLPETLPTACVDLEPTLLLFDNQSFCVSPTPVVPAAVEPEPELTGDPPPVVVPPLPPPDPPDPKPAFAKPASKAEP